MKWLEREIPRLKDLKKRRELLLKKYPGKFLAKSERPEEIELQLSGMWTNPVTGAKHSTNHIGYEKKYWKYRNRYSHAGVEQPGQ